MGWFNQQLVLWCCFFPRRFVVFFNRGEDVETKELFDRNAKDAVKVYKTMGPMGSLYGI